LLTSSENDVEPQLRQKALADKKEVKPPVFIETENLNDLARLVCALERTPFPLFSIESSGRKMIATQLDLFLGTPVFYFAYTNQVKSFLGYRTTQVGEEVSLNDSPTNPALLHAPIIEIVKMPPVFESGLKMKDERDLKKDRKFLTLEVKDLSSLVKVASYKILFEESPLPIFAFPSSSGNGKWCLGSFTRMDDFEEASIFFYFEQATKPDFNFVRYSMSRADATMTNRTDEHGYVYIKIVRLKEPHPLVELQD
jgi:hypothetical protein